MRPFAVAHLARALLIVSLATMVAVGPAQAAASKSAEGRLGFQRVEGRCPPTATVTWSGYRVHHVRVIYYLEGHSGEDAAWLNTPQFPDDRAQSSGSLTSVAERDGSGRLGLARAGGPMQSSDRSVAPASRKSLRRWCTPPGTVPFPDVGTWSLVELGQGPETTINGEGLWSCVE